MHSNPETSNDSSQSSRFSFDYTVEGEAKICVVGVGGGGGNAVNNMVRQGLHNVTFVVINTDAQALNATLAEHRIQAGRDLTKGLGTGARPDVGTQAMEESKQEVEDMLHGYDMCFIAAGMGGGTGTGGAPVLARIAREMGILAVAIVTKPFDCEGRGRMRMALEGIGHLKEHVDTLIVIPNERLLDISDNDTTIMEAFQRADSVVYDATRGIADLITCSGNINLDFADVRTTMKDGGTALMGTGTATQGDNSGENAALAAISSPLMDGVSISGARNLLVNITGHNLKIKDAMAATDFLHREAGDDVEVIFGIVEDESMQDTIRVTVVATGFGGPSTRAGTSDKALRADQAAQPHETYVSYKGEQSLKVLDIPAYERRRKGPPEPAILERDERAEIRRLDPSGRDQSRRVDRKRPEDKPAFLRKMMD